MSNLHETGVNRADDTENETMVGLSGNETILVNSSENPETEAVDTSVLPQYEAMLQENPDFYG